MGVILSCAYCNHDEIEHDPVIGCVVDGCDCQNFQDPTASVIDDDDDVDEETGEVIEEP